MAARAVAQPTVCSAGPLASAWSVSPSAFFLVPPFWRFRSYQSIFVRVVRPNAAGVRLCGSRPRLFVEEAGDIGNDLIVMTPLRQQNRAGRSAEKTGAHHG